LFVKSPSSLSVAVTHDFGSKVSPTVIILFKTPNNTGAIFCEVSFPFTIIILSIVCCNPLLSKTV
jgi:hypothetical protein